MTENEDKPIKVQYLANVAVIKRSGPFFWYVYLERGETPEELKGAYTDSQEAEKAVVALHNKKSMGRKKATD